jgi:hypothetical protein
MKTISAAAMKLLRGPIRKRLEPVIYLFGSVSFDDRTGLYTYSYVVDNRQGAFAVTQVNVLVDSTQSNFSLAPNSQTSPAGWEFDTSVSGGIANPPFNEFGTFWSWNNDPGAEVAPGTVSPVFSFTTPRAPNTVLNNNFFLFSGTAPLTPPLDGIVAFGHVVAPDIGVA